MGNSVILCMKYTLIIKYLSYMSVQEFKCTLVILTCSQYSWIEFRDVDTKL